MEVTKFTVLGKLYMCVYVCVCASVCGWELTVCKREENILVIRSDTADGIKSSCR